ncbi:hypothetical protein N7488_010374 [Penicillium malachiteum]|nr:hypothetical protein N7488_010374 [Penicillium malachiteum]
MSADPILDKKGQAITQGDYVLTKIRGGHREGEVEKVVTDQAEALAEKVTNPPKVIFTDQHGHRVAHNPLSVDKQPGRGLMGM